MNNLFNFFLFSKKEKKLQMIKHKIQFSIQLYLPSQQTNQP